MQKMNKIQRLICILTALFLFLPQAKDDAVCVARHREGEA
jgi:hypothetical protein